jgi:dihydroorotate dehydrogenase
MLRLSNGYSFTVACASGALAYGRGWWWERYGLLPLRILRPEQYTVITKTLTYEPTRGRYVWWHPFTCTLPVLDHRWGVVNCFGLTNPGLLAWEEDHYWDRGCRRVVVSYMPKDEREAVLGAKILNDLKDLLGIELNFSCPNVDRRGVVEKTALLTRLVLAHTSHPVGVKLAYQDPYLDIAKELDGSGVQWLDLVNTVPYSTVFPGHRSPLERFGNPEGGYSGPRLASYSREALAAVRGAGVKVPVISGGGIGDGEEGVKRLQMGAAAVTVGTPFLLAPWRVGRIAREILEWERAHACTDLCTPGR